MKTFYKKLSLITIFLAICSISTANLWHKVSKESLRSLDKVKRNAIPQSAQYYELNLAQLKNALQNAPVRYVTSVPSNVIISFPTDDGKLEDYRVMESPIMAASLQASLPNIRTYVAQGINDPTAYMRFSITQYGLHTMTLSGTRNPNYIDPYTTDLKYYIVYNKKSLGVDPQPFECLTNQDVELPTLKKGKIEHNKATDDQKMRTFRLAQTCTAEYGNIFATTPGNEFNDIFAQMTITINRVNSVYEVDLGITLQFIAQENLLVFWGNVNSDPWNGEYNTTTQNFLNTTLANTDYDIGHNFNTSGGGNAGCIGCVCVNGQKGSGMTGRANPTGDAFDIDYVAHEMGHQFGGYHVMNTCSRSGSGTTEVEPASGSSIMGYAGICSSNVQTNSDAHFNYVNIRDISANVKPGGTSTCAAITNITNNPPTANAGADYTIPKGTAFVLEGSATDADGMASLTYEWSENDPAQSPGNAAPQPTYAVGPMYRAKMPIVSNKRYLPRLQDVIAGNLTPTWEVTPSVGRTFSFSFLVRDNDIQGGQTADDLMQVTVDGSSGPFTVTSQTTNVTWNEGTNETVTWNVANTTASPVSAANVDILLSIDGGYTYPYTLATAVPNNGSASVIVPSGATTTTARVMVKGSNNIFYALNSSNFTIQASEFVMTFAPSANNQDVCAPNNASYNFSYDTFLGFNDVTTFSASGNPIGSTVIFSPTTAQANGTPVNISITGITAAMVGTYTITITGTAASATKSTTISLNIFDATFNPITLNSPADLATNVMGPYNFTWTADPNATTYDIDIASDAAFTTIVDNATGLATNSYTSTALSSNNTYYWRVKPSNQCGNGAFSTTFSFTTASCTTNASTNVPITISSSGTPTITSTINFPTSGTITDVNVVNLTGTHTWINDLTVKLTSPQGTIVVLWDQICGSENDFDVNFDDAAPAGALPCPPIGGGTYQPQGSLTSLNGENPIGTWTLTIKDNFNQDGGALNSWGLNICSTSSPVGVDVYSQNSIKVYPNPAKDNINIDLTNAKDVSEIFLYDVQGKVIYHNKNINTNLITIDLKELSKGIYVLKTLGNENSDIYKVLKE